MGCMLTCPESGRAKFVADVLRFRNLSAKVMDALEEHLKDCSREYVGGTTKEAARDRLRHWVAERREDDPDFWPAYGRKGPRPVAELDEDAREEEVQRRRARMLANREEGKAWAGKHHKALRQKGCSLVTSLQGKPYWDILEKMHIQ